MERPLPHPTAIASQPTQCGPFLTRPARTLMQSRKLRVEIWLMNTLADLAEAIECVGTPPMRLPEGANRRRGSDLINEMASAAAAKSGGL